MVGELYRYVVSVKAAYASPMSVKMARMPTLLAAACLPLGFLVADVTGVRPLGGLVLAALAVAAVIVARAPAGRAAAFLAITVVLFALSHVLADPLGTWGAVALVATLDGVAGHLLLD
jgi:hypothetical protein